MANDLSPVARAAIPPRPSHRALRPPGEPDPDAALVALCIENGLTMVSADTDFARFKEIAWVKPAAP